MLLWSPTLPVSTNEVEPPGTRQSDRHDLRGDVPAWDRGKVKGCHLFRLIGRSDFGEYEKMTSGKVTNR